MRLLCYVLLAACMGLCASIASAKVDAIYAFSSAQRQHDFEQLTQTLRCLVCQNQNIADSHAPMASDLKRYIARHLQQGQSATDIKRQLLARYGEYLSFAPVWHPHTYALWLLPALCMVWVVAVAVSRLRRASKVKSVKDEEQL